MKFVTLTPSAAGVRLVGIWLPQAGAVGGRLATAGWLLAKGTAMRAVVQRVREASVVVDGDTVGAIGPGLCALVGVTHDDTPESARRLADRLWGLRIMPDHEGVMNVSVADAGGQVLVVSQFTLYGDTSRGRRPSWRDAAPGAVAEPLVDAVAEALRDLGATVATGVFGADMDVHLVNDGPVTLLVEA